MACDHPTHWYTCNCGYKVPKNTPFEKFKANYRGMITPERAYLAAQTGNKNYHLKGYPVSEAVITKYFTEDEAKNVR